MNTSKSMGRSASPRTKLKGDFPNPYRYLQIKDPKKEELAKLD